MQLTNNTVREVKRAIKVKVFSQLSDKYKITTIPRLLVKRKCIFIHVPKTGGSSIANVFSNLPDNVQRINPYIRLHEHIKAKEIRDIIGSKMWESYYSFAFVRNPWDLMVSCYHWWLQRADIKCFRQDIYNIKAMENFSCFIESKYGTKMINECKGNLYNWISDEGEVIVDYVGKFENLQNDFDQICLNLNMDYIHLPHVNKTKRAHYRHYYNNKTKKLIAERFYKTIEVFNYEY